MLHFGPVGRGGLGSCEKESLLRLLRISLPGCCTRGAGRSANQAVGRAHAPRARVVNQAVGAPFECIETLYSQDLALGSYFLRTCDPVTMVALRSGSGSQISGPATIYSLLRSRGRIVSKLRWSRDCLSSSCHICCCRTHWSSVLTFVL